MVQRVLTAPSPEVWDLWPGLIAGVVIFPDGVGGNRVASSGIGA